MARTRKTRSAPQESTVEPVDLPEPKARYVLYSEWLATNKGYQDLDPATLQVALANYATFQKSPENRAANEERRAARAAATTERASSTKRSTKATKATKAEAQTAAAESAPKTRTKRATKSTSATKTTGRRGRKSAAEKADAPY